MRIFVILKITKSIMEISNFHGLNPTLSRVFLFLKYGFNAKICGNFKWITQSFCGIESLR